MSDDGTSAPSAADDRRRPRRLGDPAVLGRRRTSQWYRRHLPALGESVTEGTVTRWLKQVGDQITADEALLEVSTDKVDGDPVTGVGVLLEIRVQEDETVEVGSVLAVVGEPGAAAAEPEPEPQQTPSAHPSRSHNGAEAQAQPGLRPEPATAASGPSRSRVPATGNHGARAAASATTATSRQLRPMRATSLPWSASWPRSTASI